MTEILLAHLANQFTVLVGQTVMVFLVMLTIFGIPCVGNVFLAVLLTLLQGLCGMSFGEPHTDNIMHILIVLRDKFQCF